MSEFLSEGESVNLLSSLNGMKGKIERNKFQLNRQTMVENKFKQFVFKVLDQLTISVWKTVGHFFWDCVRGQHHYFLLLNEFKYDLIYFETLIHLEEQVINMENNSNSQSTCG